MKQPMRLIPLLLCSLSIVSSCAKFTIADANKFQKGMEPAVAMALASKGPYKFLSNPAMHLDIQVYKIAMGDYQSDYFVAFKDNKLYYWGFPYEFSRHSDPFINDIWRWAMEELKK